jgi:hypothetical protein
MNFEKATRMKLRFPFRGSISTEDLWDLNIDMLNEVYKTLSKQSKDEQEDSLLNEKTEKDSTLELQIEIVKYIFEVKTKEAEARKDALNKKKKNQKIMELIERKKEDSMANMSVEELEKLLEE